MCSPMSSSTLGSAWGTPGGKYLLVGPDWTGREAGRLRRRHPRCRPTTAGVFPRSFAARTPEAKARAIAVQNQMGVYPLSKNQAGPQDLRLRGVLPRNAVYRRGVTAANDRRRSGCRRPQWVVPDAFWEIWRRCSQSIPPLLRRMPRWPTRRATLDGAAQIEPELEGAARQRGAQADASPARQRTYEQVGVDAGNGWQRQENGGLWGSDWFGRAQAAVIYILVNDYHEATYFIRGTDAKGALARRQVHATR